MSKLEHYLETTYTDKNGDKFNETEFKNVLQYEHTKGELVKIIIDNSSYEEKIEILNSRYQ